MTPTKKINFTQYSVIISTYAIIATFDIIRYYSLTRIKFNALIFNLNNNVPNIVSY